MQPLMDGATNPQAPRRALVEWTFYAVARPSFDLWGLAPGPAREWTRARFDGLRLTLSHGCDGQAIASLELRQDSRGEWRVRLSPCSLSRMGCSDPEAMAWLDLQDAFDALPPYLPRSLASRACDYLLGGMPHG